MKKMPLILIAVLILFTGCSGGSSTAEAPGEIPSDDPKDYVVDARAAYTAHASDPRWAVPSAGLPSSFVLEASNNNVDIIFFEGRLFMAWRTAPNHFASEYTRMLIASSLDQGVTWEFENEIAVDADVREPRFLAYKGRLWLYFFEAGTDMFTFEPKGMWRVERRSLGIWDAPYLAADAGEVPWDIKVRNGKVYMTSYEGNHYIPGESAIEVYFKESEDGENFTKVNGKDYVYKGGVSEVAFEFDAEGNLWAVTRNEDGDATGFGSHVCFAPKNALAEWECSPKSDPNRYDSPEMFRHGNDIYLAARRDVGGPYDEGKSELTFDEQKSKYLMDYSLRPKGSALYKINRDARKVEKMFDLPGCGDNAFMAVRRIDAHTFLLANYTNPLDMTDTTWLSGQTSKKGTQIYLLTITFTPGE